MIKTKLKVTRMKVCGSMVESMVMAKRLGQMMLDLKEITKMIKNMEKVFYFLLMGQNSKANLKKESSRVTDVTNGNVVKNITVNG